VNADEHRPYEDDLAAYLLGALPAGEAEALERHLETCERCRERERWLRSAVDLLPSSVEQLRPPPELRERLMATVRAEAEAERAAVAEADQPRRRAEARPGIWERLRFGMRPATAALAAVVIIAAGIAGFVIGSDGDGDGGTTTVIQAQTGNATLEKSGDSGTLQVDRLPPRSGKVYQAWIARAGQDPKSAGVFDVRADGRGSVRIDRGLDTADEVLVTPEPPGGSPQPTANPVLRLRV
jgi:anti-sigma-K factor RskA